MLVAFALRYTHHNTLAPLLAGLFGYIELGLAKATNLRRDTSAQNATERLPHGCR